MSDIVERLGEGVIDRPTHGNNSEPDYEATAVLMDEAKAEITRLREALSSETAAREKAEREVERIKAVALAHVDETTELQCAHHITLADLTRKLEVAAGALDDAAKTFERIEVSNMANTNSRTIADAFSWCHSVSAGGADRAREARAAILGEEKS